MPILNLTHSITNPNRLFSQMGLADVFVDAAGLQDGDDEDHMLFETFAGIEHFPLSMVANLQHQTVLDIGFMFENDFPIPIQSTKPKKKSTTETKINRVARETEQIVESPIMKIFEHDNEQRQMKKQVQLKSGTMKRIHVSLEDEFVYMILDNISGLILSIGKYYSN